MTHHANGIFAKAELSNKCLASSFNQLMSQRYTNLVVRYNIYFCYSWYLGQSNVCQRYCYFTNTVRLIYTNHVHISEWEFVHQTSWFFFLTLRCLNWRRKLTLNMVNFKGKTKPRPSSKSTLHQTVWFLRSSDLKEDEVIDVICMLFLLIWHRVLILVTLMWTNRSCSVRFNKDDKIKIYNINIKLGYGKPWRSKA